METPELANKFYTCTSINVSQDEVVKDTELIPKELCEKCFLQLEEFYRFRKICIDANNNYRELRLQVKNRNQSEGETKRVMGSQAIETTEMIQYDGQQGEEHAKEHEGKAMKWFHCDQENCHKAYRHKGTLVMHQRKCHQLGPELASHICEYCGRAFKSLTSLNDHRYTHKDKSEMPFACKETDCSRRFATKEKLKVHMMRHKGIKNFACPYCDMRKTTRNELKIHINYHTLERTWPCRFCSKVCNSSGNLKMHVRTVHERARDFPCSYCDKSFAKPDTRKYHEMTHTGEKNFKCEECGKRFTQPAALRTHRRTHQRKKEPAEAMVLPATEAIILLRKIDT
ncbi:uncharacterized protein Dwil_GK21197 [Drosophila willistoni]|uniref:Uncharacterized protein n=1 Tax=Drosophila willistoni TaxID=7260 RepID=B4MY08_DROWI|nr:uncharacterized protein Dwil_GK21197 [Drosophila willistoni]